MIVMHSLSCISKGNRAMSEISFKLGDQGERIGDIQRKLACLGLFAGKRTLKVRRAACAKR